MLYKYISNRFLTLIENIGTGLNLSEWHTGYRAYSKKVLEAIPYQNNSDDFVFDSQLLIQAVYFGFTIGEIPVPCRYAPEASSINFHRSVVYGVGTVKTLLQFLFQKYRIIGSRLFQRSGEF